MDSLQLSKFLSFVLRHRPDAIGLSLDSQGWISVDELIAKSQAAGTQFTREDLLNVVETSDKKRFSLSADTQMIRAAQGHSVTVDLGLTPQEPPTVLYHGTATRFVASILPEFLTSCPNMELELLMTDSVINLVEDRIDLAIRIGNLESSSLIARKLAPNRRLVCGSPEYIQTRGEPSVPADLARHNCLTFSYSTGDRTWRFGRVGQAIKVVAAADVAARIANVHTFIGVGAHWRLQQQTSGGANAPPPSAGSSQHRDSGEEGGELVGRIVNVCLCSNI